VNVKDIGYKAFWTAVAVVLPTIIAYVADLSYGWVPVATVVLTAALAWVRQKTGETPADLKASSHG
jgi:hypothetical protein